MIDTAVQFNEIHRFRDSLSKQWKLDCIVPKIREAKQAEGIAADNAKSGTLHHMQAIEECMKRNCMEGLLTAIRWDEQETGPEETYYSVTKGVFRINPMLHFMKKDIWEYMRRNKVPYCARGDRKCRSAECERCITNNPAHGLEQRKNRDDAAIRERLRELGYL